MAMNRRDLVIPEAWQVTRDARVQVLPLGRQQATTRGIGRPPAPWQPAGVWRTIDRSPDMRGTGSWWLQPVDDAARAWTAAHRADVTQGCVSVPGRLIVPAFLQLDLDTL